MAYSFLRALCDCRILREGIWASICLISIFYINICLQFRNIQVVFLTQPSQFQNLFVKSSGHLSNGNILHFIQRSQKVIFYQQGQLQGLIDFADFTQLANDSEWIRTQIPASGCIFWAVEKLQNSQLWYCFVCQISQIQLSNVRWVAGWNVPKNCKSSLETMQCCFLLWIIA